jgi:hypothetical protein
MVRKKSGTPARQGVGIRGDGPTLTGFGAEVGADADNGREDRVDTGGEIVLVQDGHGRYPFALSDQSICALR